MEQTHELHLVRKTVDKASADSSNPELIATQSLSPPSLQLKKEESEGEGLETESTIDTAQLATSGDDTNPSDNPDTNDNTITLRSIQPPSLQLKKEEVEGEGLETESTIDIAQLMSSGDESPTDTNDTAPEPETQISITPPPIFSPDISAQAPPVQQKSVVEEGMEKEGKSGPKTGLSYAAASPPPVSEKNNFASTEVIQNKSTTASSPAQPFQLAEKENNTGLPDNLKSGIENMSGFSMDDVNVNYNSDKPAQLNAHAYAQGTNIEVAPGQEKHVPHEAWHVVQQKQGRVQATTQMKGKVPVNDDVGLEKEADIMGAKANSKLAFSNRQTIQNKEINISNTPLQPMQALSKSSVSRGVTQLKPPKLSELKNSSKTSKINTAENAIVKNNSGTTESDYKDMFNAKPPLERSPGATNKINELYLDTTAAVFDHLKSVEIMLKEIGQKNMDQEKHIQNAKLAFKTQIALGLATAALAGICVATGGIAIPAVGLIGFAGWSVSGAGGVGGAAAVGMSVASASAGAAGGLAGSYGSSESAEAQGLEGDKLKKEKRYQKGKAGSSLAAGAKGIKKGLDTGMVSPTSPISGAVSVVGGYLDHEALDHIAPNKASRDTNWGEVIQDIMGVKNTLISATEMVEKTSNVLLYGTLALHNIDEMVKKIELAIPDAFNQTPSTKEKIIGGAKKVGKAIGNVVAAPFVFAGKGLVGAGKGLVNSINKLRGKKAKVPDPADTQVVGLPTGLRRQNTSDDDDDDDNNAAAAAQTFSKSRSSSLTAIPMQLKAEENNTGLPDQLKSGIENMSGYSMDDVKVNYNSEKPAQLNAHAYAQGNNIEVASGQEKHLPHEAWHVVQQKQGRVQPTKQMKGKTPVNDDAGLEKEADVMGAKAISQAFNLPSEKLNESKASKNVSQLDTTNWGYNIDGTEGEKTLNKDEEGLVDKINSKLAKSSGSLVDLEKIANLLSYIDYSSQEISDEVLNKFKSAINEKFVPNSMRAYYLNSILNDDFHSSKGEPSITATLILLAGGIHYTYTARDLDEMIEVTESASKEQLQELTQNTFVRNELFRLLRSNNDFADATNSKLQYIKNNLSNQSIHHPDVLATLPHITGIKNDQEEDDIGKQKATVKDIRNTNLQKEAISLLKIYESELLTLKSKAKLLQGDEASFHLREWATKLTGENITELTKKDDSNLIYKHLKDINANDRYINYIFSCFKSNSLVEDEDEDERTLSAESFVAFMENKKIGAKKRPLNRIASFLDKVNRLNHNQKIKVLHLYYDIASLNEIKSNFEKRENAIGLLEVAFRDLGIKRDKLEILVNAFRFGATNLKFNDKSTVSRIYKLIGSKKPGEIGKKLHKLLLDLDPVEFTQFRQNSDFITRLNELKAKENKGVNIKVWNSIYNILHLDNKFDQVKLDSIEGNDKETGLVQETKDLLEFDPIYWARLIAIKYKSKVSYAKGKQHTKNKNKTLTLMSQCYYAAQRAVQKNIGYESINAFTLQVYLKIKEHNPDLINQPKLQAGFQALYDGRPISVAEKMDAAELRKSKPSRLFKGVKLKVSAIEDMISHTHGQELLHGLTDYEEFVKEVKALPEGEQISHLVSYLPSLKPDILNKINTDLPVKQSSTLIKAMLDKIADALEEDEKYKSLLGNEGMKNLDIRAEMLRSVGLMNREAIVDTGWQMKYFSTKATSRLEAKNAVIARYRKVKRGVIETGNQEAGESLKSDTKDLAGSNQIMGRRTSNFNEAKEKAVDRIIFALSIVLGLITTGVTLGTAAPLIAAGFTAVAAQYFIAILSTLASSVIKQTVKKFLVGAAHNDREALVQIAKDVILSATTVAAGGTSEAISGIEGNAIEAIKHEGAKRLVNNLVQVSTVEVAYRTVVETAIDNFLASESSEQTKVDWRMAARYVRDFTLDGLLKTTFETMTASISDKQGAYNKATKRPVASNMTDLELKAGLDDGSIITWIPHKLDGGQVLAILAGENFITSQNYSVAEQDSIGGELLDMAVDRFMPMQKVERTKKEQKSDSGAPLHIDDLRRIPPAFVFEAMFTVENFLEYYAKHKNILLKLDFTKVSKPKLVSFIGSLIKQKVSLEELKIVFRSIDSEEVENIYSRITKRIQKSNDKRHFQELRELGKEERERVERENQLDEAGLIDLDILSEEEEEEEADGSDNGDHFEAVGQYL